MYTELAEIPVPAGGSFVAGHDSVELLYSVRDHTLNTKSTLIKTVSAISEVNPVISLATQRDDSQIASLYSPSGAKRVVLRETKDKKQRVVELWKETSKVASIDVTDHHDSFYADEYLGSLNFSDSEDAIVYTAEGRSEETDSFSKFRYRPDFGEGLNGKRRPATFIIGWPMNKTTKPILYRLQVPANPSVRFGQHVFVDPRTWESARANTFVLFATGYQLQPDGRLLGVKGCFNRPSGIWKIEGSTDEPQNTSGAIPISCTATKVTPSNLSCRSPRVVPGSVGHQTLVFLGCTSGGPHVTASTIYAYSPSGSNPVIKKLSKPFYPPYNLASSPYLKNVNGGSIAHHTHVPGSRTIIAIETPGSERFEVDGIDEDNLYSWSVLATDGKSKILCWRSSPNTPYEIGILDVDSTEGVVKVAWKLLDKPSLSESVSDALSTIKTTVEISQKSADKSPIETIVIASGRYADQGAIPPCILVPHGGPHGTTTTAFSAGTTSLVLEGYTLALPNYTGSLGYGEDFVHALVGKCGRTDVDECIESIDNLVSKGIAEEGPGRLFVMGGSHGGFLAAHLIGQFPTKFSGAVMRNPVISVGETSTTDIPDWYFSEFGFPYPVYSSSSPLETSPTSIPPLMTAPTFTQLQTSSPIHYVDATEAPVLLLIGLSDRRVAPTHGIEYYHALTARKREVELLTFEGEGHPLDGVEAARVCWEAGRDWFGSRAKR